jgi:SAM-dependent methyltransferase
VTSADASPLPAERRRAGLAEQERQAVRAHSDQADEFASRYQRLAGDPYRSCFAYSRHRLDDWLENLLPPRGEGLRLLDLGCGTGHHLARYAARGFDVVGLDGSMEMLRHALRILPGAALRRAGVDALPFRDETFDVVLSIEVLRYLPDPQPSLEEAARVLRPGGLLVATAAPRLSLNGYWLVNRLATRLPVPGLVRLKQFFTTSLELRRRLRGAGFGSVEVHGAYFGPVNWVERIAPRLLPGLLRGWQRLDRAIADRPFIREFGNMFVVRAVRDSRPSVGRAA